jgi:hypothetical protein
LYKKIPGNSMLVQTDSSTEMEDQTRVYVDAGIANQTSVYTDRPWIIALFGGLSVFSCCLFSQVIASSAKKSKLRLNKYYARK